MMDSTQGELTMTDKKEKWCSRLSSDDRWYKVIDETDDSVCVEDIMEYAQKPYFRKLTMWWDKELCEIIEVNKLALFFAENTKNNTENIDMGRGAVLIKTPSRN